MQRLQVISGHLCPPSSGEKRSVRLSDCAAAAAAANGADDVVVVHGLRTPICKAKPGAFKVRLYAAHNARRAAERGHERRGEGRRRISPPAGRRVRGKRAAARGRSADGARGSLPQRLPRLGSRLRRQQAVRVRTAGRPQRRRCHPERLHRPGPRLRRGEHVSAFHAESRRLELQAGGQRQGQRLHHPHGVRGRTRIHTFTASSDNMVSVRACVCSVTSENVAERFGISREKQDAFALTSHQKAARAQASGAFRDELVPVVTKMAAQDGSERQAKVTEDDGVRPGSTLAALAKLPAVFKAGGTTTAGNSSQVSDGAAAVLLGRRAVVEALGLPVLGVLRASAVVGVPPDVMGIGPAFAIPEALRRAGKMTSQGALRRRFTSFSGPFSVRACVRLRTQDWAWPTWTCLRSTRPSPARRCTAWRSWASPGRRSTPTAAPSLWATRWAAPARGRSSRCCTTSDDAAQGRTAWCPCAWVRGWARPPSSNIPACERAGAWPRPQADHIS
ncbi:3-ketoacyl-CoA thiolase, peroxisomal isoform X3 [Vanacampus margaritifer]